MCLIWSPFLISVIMEMFLAYLEVFGSILLEKCVNFLYVFVKYKGTVIFKLYLVKPQVFIKCVLEFLGKLDMWSRGYNFATRSSSE